MICQSIFQSTLPREERQLSRLIEGTSSTLFQSTLPREERQSLLLRYDLSKYISIHAPTRGATKGRFHSFREQLYFNPRSHERSDNSFESNLNFAEHFNPRSHERSDTGCLLMRARNLNFNPRSHERSDAYHVCINLHNSLFQSTLPREERQQYCTKNLFIFIQYRQ